MLRIGITERHLTVANEYSTLQRVPDSKSATTEPYSYCHSEDSHIRRMKIGARGKESNLTPLSFHGERYKHISTRHGHLLYVRSAI